MPRPPKKKIEFNYDSLREHFQEGYQRLEDFRLKGVYEYNKVMKLLNKWDNKDPKERLQIITQLENSRFQALSYFDKYVKNKKEFLDLHFKVTKEIKNQESGNNEKESGLSESDKKHIQEFLKNK